MAPNNKRADGGEATGYRCVTGAIMDDGGYISSGLCCITWHLKMSLSGSQSENEFIWLRSRRLIRVIAVPAQLRDNQVFFFFFVIFSVCVCCGSTIYLVQHSLRCNLAWLRLCRECFHRGRRVNDLQISRFADFYPTN